jgi:peptidoglycan/xylan/chitin deacetylase (PgdA/CDA1 family)
MFEATGEFAFFDYFRIPYRITPEPGPGFRTLSAGGPFLAWPDGTGTLGKYHLGENHLGENHLGENRPGENRPGGIPFVARVGDDGELRSRRGLDWQPIATVVDDGGDPVAAVWRDAGGNLLLPFDPGEVMWRFFSEHYQDADRRAGLRAALVRAYYALRPAIPRPVQIALRRAFTRVQEQAPFPAFPVETALHDFYDWLFRLVAGLADRPVPWLGLWPDDHDWALVLTHDVETAAGLAGLDRLRDIERAAGHPSSWNFVPRRYEMPAEVPAALEAEGCEVGVHGLRHDGRDLGSLRLLRRRLPAIRDYAGRWGAVGFRSPATQRTWEWMPLLGFEYDTSYHDTAPYEPRPGGSCSYLPYFIGDPGRPGDMVELPITLPMDHTLFTILRAPDATTWLDKAAFLRSRGGMALILTHPDYAGDPRVTEGYRRLLETYAEDPTVWRALPREVAAWWQRRARSTVEPDGDGWVVRGPAAGEGRVRTWPAA